MRSAAVLLACRAAGLAPSPARRHALALLAARRRRRRRRPAPARDDLMHVPNMCELNVHMLLGSGAKGTPRRGRRAGHVPLPARAARGRTAGASTGRSGRACTTLRALCRGRRRDQRGSRTARPGAGARRFRVVGGQHPRARTRARTPPSDLARRASLCCRMAPARARPPAPGGAARPVAQPSLPPFCGAGCRYTKSAGARLRGLPRDWLAACTYR